MIKNHDRSKWFGASDTHYIMGKWNTKTFAKWWCVKLGLIKNNFQTKETMAGTNYEHRIAGLLSKYLKKQLKLDRQFKKRKYGLRINLDAETKDKVVEIKTYKNCANWKLPKAYIMQVRVQGYFAKKKCFIATYAMEPENYDNYFLPLLPDHFNVIEIEQDLEFIEQYKKRILYLKKCLKKGIIPKEGDLC